MDSSSTTTELQTANVDTGDFMRPASEEIVRRAWRCAVGGKIRMVDIWEAPIPGKYYYAIREEGSRELLAQCWTPCRFKEIRVFVETELAPTSPSKPFRLKAGNRSKNRAS